MRKSILTAAGILLGTLGVWAQPRPVTECQPLSYYMPQEWDYTLDEAIPTPQQELGFQVGEQHVLWEHVVSYMQKLASVSPRISIKEYGRTHENRPVICVVITSEKNQQNLEQIRQSHCQLADPSAQVDISSQPVVCEIMESIHGNEPSGVNSSLPLAYFFAAAKGAEIDALLDKTVICLIPGQNPDGISRFASWVNSHRSLRNVMDPQSMEFHEYSPSSRVNHYWHDLNRDWINVTQPEMKAILQVYHDWMPNTVNDHHEKGTNQFYFLEPSDPVGYNPIIPQENRDLTLEISQYNMKALDRIGTIYLSKDEFDSWSLGTGDVYSDVLGSVAMLFEEPSSRGHGQETDNGELTFASTIRNHATTAFGTIHAAYDMREKLNDYMHRFAVDRMNEARKLPLKGWVFDGNGSEGIAFHFIEMLRSHNMEVHRLAKATTLNGHTYQPENAYFVPAEQHHSILLRSLFDTNTTFKDSLFYDLSVWNMPEAYGLNYAEVKSAAGMSGDRIDKPVFPKGQMLNGKSSYAYLFDNQEYYAPLMLNRLLEANIRVMVSGEGGKSAAGYSYGPGMLIVPVAGQKVSNDSIYQTIEKLAKETGITVRSVSTGQMNDFDLGHTYNKTIRKPKVAIVTSGSNSTGSMWHLLNYRFQMQPTLLDAATIGRMDLNRYNVLIMDNAPQGGKDVEEKVAEWVKAGGTLITVGRAYSFTNKAKLTDIKVKPLEKPDSAAYIAYDKRQDEVAKYTIPGTNLSVTLDTTHPLGWGYRQSQMPVLKNSTLVFEMPKEANKCPVWYDKQNPLLSGFLRPKHKEALKGMPEAICQRNGQGVVISFADDLNFRSSWLAGSRMFMNAIFFGNLIR